MIHKSTYAHPIPPNLHFTYLPLSEIRDDAGPSFIRAIGHYLKSRRMALLLEYPLLPVVLPSSRNHQLEGDTLICAGCSAYNNALATAAGLEAEAEAAAEIYFSPVAALTGSSPRSIGGG